MEALVPPGGGPPPHIHTRESGIEKWFEATLERAPNEMQEAPDNIDEVAARYIAAAPRYGLEFV
jgi:hypothetical protein